MVILNPLIGVLIVIISMVIPAIIMFFIYLSARYELYSSGTEKTKLYACGEEIKPIQASASVENLVWTVIKKSMRSVFTYIREVIHSGVLNDWLTYMISFFGFLVLILVVVAFTQGW